MSITKLINRLRTMRQRYALSAARLTQPYKVKLAHIARLRDVLGRTCSLLERVIMRETEGHIEATESGAAFGTSSKPTRPITWCMTAKAKPHSPFEFESVLLAIAGHGLRQPLQVIENAHQFLGRGVRTASDLRLLQSAQRATDRLRDQLDELVAALRLREHAKGLKLMPVRVGPLLEQATGENEVEAQKKGLSVRAAPTSAMIESNALLLGTILRNLVNNACRNGFSQLVGMENSNPISA
jgi:two-component system, OmpR family, phosphate regulon sensor histidine kinase PhoR